MLNFDNSVIWSPTVREEMPACLTVTGRTLSLWDRWSSKLHSTSRSSVSLATLECMGIMKMEIATFNTFQTFPLQFRKSRTDESSVLERNSNSFWRKVQTKSSRNWKLTERAESTTSCGHFGTYARTQLPIGFENGPMKVGDLDLHFRQAAMSSNVKEV